MIPFSSLSSLYDYLSSRRILLFSFTAAVILACVIAFRYTEIREDITDMIPGKPRKLALHFRLLQEAPFSKKVLINLEAGPDTGTGTLIDTVDRLAGEMAPPLFTEVLTGPPSPEGGADFFSFLLRALPSLATEEDLRRIEQRLTREKIRSYLREMRSDLLSPGGWGLEEAMRRDPLQFRTLVLSKMRHLSLIPEARLKDNHLISRDGKSALIIANTPIEITDSRGSQELVSRFQGLVKRVVPDSINTSLISGHRYTAANVNVIHRDLLVVLGCSCLAILALFVYFLRSRSGVFVFLVPVSALFAAVAGVALVYGSVSAMTIGFGSVLLGITVDFALHVYFALRRGEQSPAKTLCLVSRPVLFCGLTSIAAFATLLFSNLPGQRQLAVFAVTGIGASLAFSLIALPHLVRPAQDRAKPSRGGFPPSTRSAGKWIIAGWLVLLCLCLWQAVHIRFDGDLRTLNYTTEEMEKDQERLRETWGNVSGRALIFARGRDLDSALESNEEVFYYLQRRIPLGKTASIAPLIPSLETRRQNLGRWREFWDQGRLERLRVRLLSEAQALGFSPHAFTPFLERLSSRPEPIGLRDWRKAGLGRIFDSLIAKEKDSVNVLTLVPDTPETANIIGEAEEDVPNIEFVSRTAFGRMISKALGKDFRAFLLRASLAVILLLVIFFARPGKILYTLVPVATGLIFMFGMMGALGVPFNLFNVVAAILVIGLAVDYGIFMVSRLTEGYDLATEKAVLVSGLTTLAGFGALILAKHPALHSIGVTVLFGIAAAVPSALFVIPVLFRDRTLNKGQED